MDMITVFHQFDVLEALLTNLHTESNVFGISQLSPVVMKTLINVLSS